MRGKQKRNTKEDIFVLGELNDYGQRINIEIELPRKDRIGIVKFVSGWMVYPNGRIQLVTPCDKKALLW
ncbi:MAG: hypothetical protein HFE35_06950 [Clostridia bacterium]|nr:hypothetical protein [Clostridia bacterium]